MNLLSLSRSCLCAIALSASLLAGDDKESRTTTGWSWYYGQSEAQLDTLAANGQRIIDLDVESTSPYRFRVATVRNTGTYAQTWWWHYGYDAAQLATFISSNNARLIDIEPVVINGAVRFAFVALSNLGANAKGWWWYYGLSAAEVQTKVNTNAARLVDIERYTVNNVTYFAALMIKNTGADQRQWWWGTGITQATLSSQASSQAMRPYDVDRVSATTFDAILTERDPDVPTAWLFNVSEAALNGYLGQYGFRPFDVDANGSNFDAFMILNATDLARTTNAAMRALTDGMSGLLLQRINGTTHAAIHSTTQFEPASLLKTLHHFHAMRQVRLGAVSLATKIPVTTGAGSDCPSLTATFLEDLESVLTAMMQNSDNRRCRAVTDYFGGFAVLNATAGAIGMSSTDVNHHIGCGSPANRLTLADLSDLHKAVVDGWLATQRAKFYELMLNSISGFAGPNFLAMLDQEAANLGLTASQYAAFKANLALAYKGGSYGINGLAYRSLGGYVAVPFLQNHVIVKQEYCAGVFVDGASDAGGAANARDAGMTELLREVMRAGMATWKSYVVGSLVAYGIGCPGSAGVPVHTATGTPDIGGQVDYALSTAPKNTLATLMLGNSNTLWNSTPLPFHMNVLGATNCYLRANPLVTFNGSTGASGSMSVPLDLPLIPALVGGKLYTQYLVVDPPANALGIVTTRGITTSIGG